MQWVNIVLNAVNIVDYNYPNSYTDTDDDSDAVK